MNVNPLAVAEEMLNDPRWEDAPDELYDGLIERYGPGDAVRLWFLALRLYDRRLAEDESARFAQDD